MLSKCLATLCLLLAFAAQAQDIEIRKEKLYDRPVRILDNGLIQTAVTPEIGARVLDFRLKGRDHARALQIHRHYINRQPGEQWQGGEYGGLADMATQGWPGEIWGLVFDVDQIEVAGTPAVQFTTEYNQVQHQRRVTLLPESTVLQYHTTQKNLADQTQKLTIRIHAELAVGESADDFDRIYLVDDKGHKEIVYRLGWENPRLSWEHPGAWIACVDTREKIAVVRWFHPVTNDKVLIWHGQNVGGPVRDMRGGFYGIDRFMQEQNVAPGQKIEAQEDLAIIEGLSRVDFAVAENYVAGELLLDQAAYGPAEEATLTLVIGGGLQGNAHKARIYTGPSDGADSELASLEIPAYKAGKAASASTSFVPKESCKVRAEIFNAKGEQIAECAREIKVDAKTYAAAAAKQNQLKQKVEVLLSALAENGLKDQSTGQAQMQLARFYADEYQALMEKGNFQEAIELADAYMQKLEKAIRQADKAKKAEESRASLREITKALQ